MAWVYECISCYVAREPWDSSAVPLYRCYNGSDHFYTINASEYRKLPRRYRREDIACWVAPRMIPSFTPFYQLYHAGIDDHFYTTSENEKHQVVAGGWHEEGIACYVRASAAQGFVPLYRAYHQGVGDHFYTTNICEIARNFPSQSLWIKLDSFKSLDQCDGDPYIWPLGIIIDAVSIAAGGPYVSTTSGAHHNVGTNYRTDHTRGINPVVGDIAKRIVEPHMGFTIAGLLIVCWEQRTKDSTTVITNDYMTVAAELNGFIASRIKGFNLSNATLGNLAALRDAVMEQIRDRYSEEYHWCDSSVSLDGDNCVGFKQQLVLLSQVRSHNSQIRFTFKRGNAHYQLGGYFLYQCKLPAAASL